MKKKNPIPFRITIRIVYFFALIGLAALIWVWSTQRPNDESTSLARVNLPTSAVTLSNDNSSHTENVENSLANTRLQEPQSGVKDAKDAKDVKQGGLPSNPNASTATRQLLAWLQRPNPGCQVIAGQDIQMFDDASNNYENLVKGLHTETGRWVGLLGADYNSWSNNKDWSNTNRILIDYWQQGGLVEVNWNANNPWTGDVAWEHSQRDLRQLLKEGTAQHDKWMAQLTHVADGLNRLQEAGVVVLWRPFSAMNADWYWWGAQNHPDDPKPMQALWQQMFQYFTDERGLNNLLWVYTIAYKDAWDSSTQTVDFYYPGDRYVDIVGQVLYAPTLDHLMYQELLAFGKPIALTEFGISSQPGPLTDGSYDYLSMLNQIKEQYPQLLYWLSWGDWMDNGKVNNSIRSNRNAIALMNHDCVVTRDEIHWQTMQP